MRVLILGAGGAAAIGYTRALRLADAGYHLIGADINPDGLLFAETDETHLIGTSNKDLHQLIWDTKPDFVHGQPDEEVLRLSRMRNAIRPARWFLPSHAAIVTCQDKWESYERWRDAGVPVPETQLVRGRETLYNTIAATGQQRWLRRRTGAGGAGSLCTYSYDLALAWVREHRGFGEFTCAEVMPGESVTWTSIWWQGELVASQQRRRVSWANARSTTSGVSGSTGIGVTCSDPRVEEVAPAACLAIDKRPHGIWSVDMTRDRDGGPRVTEINPGRFFTTVPEFFARAGFNIAHWYTQVGRWPVPLDFSEESSMRNPLPDGLRWHRIMDREPILEDTHARKEISQHQAAEAVRSLAR